MHFIIKVAVSIAKQAINTQKTCLRVAIQGFIQTKNKAKKIQANLLNFFLNFAPNFNLNKKFAQLF